MIPAISAGQFGIVNQEPGDPYWSNVVLLLQGDGVDGSTTFIDEKGHTMTANGNAQVATAVRRFGEGSIFCDGSGDYVTTPDHADFDLGSGDFTIEGWCRIGSTRPSNAQALLVKRASSSVRGPFAILVPANTTKFQLLLATTAGSYAVNLTSTTSPGTGTWTHFAAVRSGTDVYLFSGGVQEGGTGSVSGALLTNTDSLSLGRDQAGTDTALNGYLDSVRITKGVARYTGTFTPPSRALPAH